MTEKGFDFKSLDLSKEPDQKKFDEEYGRLSEEERKKIVNAAEDEAIDIDVKAKELAGEGEKPTVRNYQDASDQIDSEKEQKEIVLTPEKRTANQRLIMSLSKGQIYNAIRVINYFHIPEEVLSSPEVIEAAKQGLINSLSKDLSKRRTDDAIEIIDKFHIPKEVLSSPEVIELTKQRLITCLSDGYTDDAIEIIDKFHIPKEVLSSPEVIDAAKQKLVRCLSNRYVMDSIKIISDIRIPEEVLSSPEVIEAAKQGLIKCLSMGHTDDAIDIKENFNTNISALDILQNIPKLQEIVDRINNLAPGFTPQISRSTESAIALCEFIENPDELISSIESNPFLKDALFENPRFASKLIIKYPQFDELSQENIQTLFDAKKEILAQNLADAKAMAGKSDIDPESLEFRQLMQEKLKEYKNNPEILEAIKESGVNVDEWLNYSETQYFNLESDGSHLAFSEVIQTPINRIKETIDSYAHTLKETLKEYKSELSEFKIPLEDSRESEEKIVKMQEELEKANAEGNERKAKGVEKGIESLKKKSENIKTVALWDKLLGDISAFQQLKNDVFSAQEKLTQAEKDMQEKLGDKMPSGKMIQELKEKINKAKEELRSKFIILERRIEDFKTNLPELIAPCLGQERSEALIQEIKQNLAQQFDHWNTDRSTLANFFSERGDKEKGKLENQPMSIFVWARNPDIDLYQGNYTNCCIRIDSTLDSAESTIADYNTDLGVQIVNIWDETKNEPVTAAWCWIGKDSGGEIALIVDNIEANGSYSINYAEQLTKELFDYLKEYAKAIGVEKMVLGKANNDLPTAGEINKMPADRNSNDYEKVGEYNRVDGYYLEAIKYGTKLISKLEERGDKVEPKNTKESQIKKIEYGDLSIKNLSEKDFAKIKQLERKIYAGTDLVSGQAMIEDIKQSNGLEYSIVINGKKDGESEEEIIGYIAATEDETDEGDASVYLEDIAVIPEAQGQGIGWEMLKSFIERLKAKARKEDKPILLDMHLRENSQRFMERHHNDLEQMGAKLIEEAIVPAGYYYSDEDALYQVYEIESND